MTQHPPGDDPDVRFERTDVDATSLLKFGFWLVVATTVVVLLLWRLFFVFVAQEAARQPPPPVMKPDAAVLAPPPPLLQTAPAKDLAEFRAQEDQVLASYGWVDKEQKVARIPIEEAMRLVAERGLPVPVVSPTPAAGAAKTGAKPAAKAGAK